MSFTIHTGDALEVLRTLPSESVQMCCTSPPFYGLRDYGTGQWEGGETGCEHKIVVKSRISRERNGLTGGLEYMQAQEQVYRSACGKCGARRIDKQIGLEETPALYVERLVEVFREVRRVLKNDGVLWLNLGDSYAGSTMQVGNNGINSSGGEAGFKIQRQFKSEKKLPSGLKPKDLIGIPWMVAFALRADGWWLRSDIIWAKPNPMPESVQDRCTRSHEYIFMLAKSERYYYDAAAIAEAATDTRGCLRIKDARANAMGRNPSGNERPEMYNVVPRPTDRNKRSVWAIPTLPTPEAHFATYAIELPETCILAGSKEGDTVIDPFSGAGTTGLACLKHGRRYIGIELNPDYVTLSYARAERICPLLISHHEPVVLSDEEPRFLA